MCKLSLSCTGTCICACKLSMTCTEEVSFAEIEILNTMVKGLFDNETREEILLKSPEMDLLATIAFVEAKETAGVLMEASMASSQINKVTTQYKSGKKQKDNLKDKCGYCGRTGHGKRASLDIQKDVCKAHRVTCNKCLKVNHLKKFASQRQQHLPMNSNSRG